MDAVKKYAPYIPIALIVFIFAQSMPFKFGLIDSVTPDHIFPSVGKYLGLKFYEDYGAQITGIMELVAIILLLIKGTRHYGALLALGIMTGAIFFHFTAIGLTVPVDVECENGLAQAAVDMVGTTCTEEAIDLFVMANIAWLSAAYLVWDNRKKLPVIGGKF